MNLQKLFRVAVCAAIIAMCVIGAGLFPAQSAAGYASKPLALRDAEAIDHLKQDGQYDSLQAAFNQSRFSVSRAENTPLGRAAWHAPNTAAGYDAYITEEGVSIAINDESHVSLNLRGLGYGKALRAISPGEVSGDKQTINIARDGGVTEWYINGPEGLEQGFTLMEAPGAQQAGEPLRLALEVSEGWRAVASEDGQKVTLRSAEDQAVDYSKLIARDHEGRDIPARLMVADQQVIIEVDDSEAAYPLTIDPLFTFQNKLLAPDGGTNDHLGHSVALSGNTVAVGARGEGSSIGANQGAVYIFTRNGAAWTFQQKITAGDGSNGDYFGWSVGLDGDTLVVGAYHDEIGGNLERGSAYIFTRNGAAWTEQQKLVVTGGLDYDWFGRSVAISGDTVVVGAPGDDRIYYTNAGSAYVYKRYGSAWQMEDKLTAPDGASYDFFGWSVAIDGDTVVVGATGDTIGSNQAQGSAHVFTRAGVSWTYQQKLTSNIGYFLDHFGHSVAISGNTVVVGAYISAVTHYHQGVAYVFTRTGTTWTQQQKLIANDAGEYDFFGGSVAINGDMLVVGAYGDTVNGQETQGSLYVFMRNGSTWAFQQKITASDGGWYDFFGFSVAMSSDTIVAGALGDRIGTNSSQGSAYVFYSPICAPLTFSPDYMPVGAVDVPYQQQVTVSGGTGPYTFSLGGTTLPPGILLSTGGLLSGMPTMSGAYQFRIVATDTSTGCSSSRSYTLTIETCDRLMLEPSPLPDGTVDKEYNVQLTPSGGREPYTFVVKGDLPPGLSLTPEGHLIGTPAEDGSFYFRLIIMDARGCSGVFECPITILKGE